MKSHGEPDVDLVIASHQARKVLLESAVLDPNFPLPPFEHFFIPGSIPRAIAVPMSNVVCMYIYVAYSCYNYLRLSDKEFNVHVFNSYRNQALLSCKRLKNDVADVKSFFRCGH